MKVLENDCYTIIRTEYNYEEPVIEVIKEVIRDITKVEIKRSTPRYSILKSDLK